MNHHPRPIVQIYGIRSVKTARAVVDMGVKHIGVSYGKIHRTPGQLTCEQAKDIFENVQPHAVRVGLTVTSDLDEIRENLAIAMPDVLHLSGDIDEISPEEILSFKSEYPGLKILQPIPVLPNVPLGEQPVIDYVKRYEKAVDFFLTDTKAPGTTDIGATGIVHDFAIDKAIVETSNIPVIIAGGLTAENLQEAISIAQPYGVDSFSWTNYQDERANTLDCKDLDRVRAFVEAARHE
ncbi:phosphoribosylanthranilate isomerase [Actinotignum urinale]|uniref:N-(5'-phosphoribosyl)anthranilate isomerase n=1 Tax=Actinotignum urinale TaxID=190146 RepID=A0AAW9HLZ4_9ACTO|nr:phosphoribosylanthranilate isomerase [Actinotignum urinale]MDY5128962.1 phosphoribosylanthranilate isomerase [Actinotignum urinale]MDY5132482.1 phosphoribosylanthranilate isomerase [Actinotignum urinale]MDY5151063.1 phosphoribosylanthranilate isomerase [Actinotignum urinale]MDY5154762.1 phosphoribosylanthranilate isomerase [Actinotignum urinale]